jgi:hypothetical protein
MTVFAGFFEESDKSEWGTTPVESGFNCERPAEMDCLATVLRQLNFCDAKCFLLVTTAGRCVASAALRREERDEFQGLEPGDGDNPLQVRLNSLAVILSFGFVMRSCSGPFENDHLEEMPERVIPRAMLQGANETGDYFWDVWREPNDRYGAVPMWTAPIFF